jgi:DNA polymerase III subunit delta
MPPATERALRTAITRHAFDPVYYLFGDDDFRKDQAVAELITAAVDPAVREFNAETLRAADVEAVTLHSILSTPPMMADRRAVVVRDVAALRKDARAALDHYLQHPASDAVVVLVAAAGGKADRALQERATAVEFTELTGDRLADWIALRAELLGVTITPDASTLLQSAVGNDLAQLAGELDKLASYVAGRGAGGTAIDEDAVGAVVGVVRGETLGDLLDRIADGDAPRALSLLPHVLSLPKVSAVSIVMALATQTLALAAGRATNLPASRLSGEYFALLKETGAYPGRPWGEAVSAWARATDRWTLPALDRALEALLAADAALKDTRVSSDEQLLASLVLTICAEIAPPSPPVRTAA